MLQVAEQHNVQPVNGAHLRLHRECIQQGLSRMFPRAVP